MFNRDFLTTVTGPACFPESHKTGAMENQPSIFYRYLNHTYGLDAIQKGQWKIGRVTELNDPLDCEPQLINFESTTESEIKNEYADLFGILCYSRTINSPVLWSHYGDRHQGIALGFDYSKENWKPQEVIYCHERPTLDYKVLENLSNTDATEDVFLRKLITDGYLTKAKGWAYEDEYRHFIALQDKDCRMEGVNYFRGIPFPNLCEIVLGINCKATENDILRILKKQANNIKNIVSIKRCSKTKDRFDLTVKHIERFVP